MMPRCPAGLGVPGGGHMAPDQILLHLRDFMINLVGLPGADPTARQLGILLVIHQTPGPHTVRGLAAHLEIARPAISRSLDRLEEFGWVKRRPDPLDRRSIFVTSTKAGNLVCKDMQVGLKRSLAKARIKTEEVAA